MGRGTGKGAAMKQARESINHEPNQSNPPNQPIQITQLVNGGAIRINYLGFTGRLVGAGPRKWLKRALRASGES